MPRRAAGRRNTMSIWRSALKKRRGRRPISLNSAELPLVTRSGQAQGAITASIQRERVTWRVPLNRMSLQPRRCVNTFIGGLDDDSSISTHEGQAGGEALRSNSTSLRANWPTKRQTRVRQTHSQRFLFPAPAHRPMAPTDTDGFPEHATCSSMHRPQ